MDDILHLRVWGTGVLILPLILGCQPVTPTPSITSQRCEKNGDFVWIEPGNYILGSDRKERDYAYRISAEAVATKAEQVDKAETNLRNKGWFNGEADRQVLALSEVCMGRNLITNAEYQAFVQATGHRSPYISAGDYQKQGFLVHSYSSVKPYLWQEQTFPAGQGQHPVVLVSYKDAQAFAQWRGQQDGNTYRLPTAMEWEQAARGGDSRLFPWGHDWRADATNWANFGGLQTSAIATFPLSRSPDGVEDMAGNVFEYTSTLTQQFIQKAVVLKGCSWDDLPGFCRAAYQHTRPVDSRHILFGFRLVKE